MYAKNLERILALLCERSDVSHGSSQEFDERFKSLRDYGRLPRGRERREEKLSDKHIAAAVFGLATIRPNWAGYAAIGWKDSDRLAARKRPSFRRKLLVTLSLYCSQTR